MSGPLAALAEEEVRERHRFFVRWFNGEGPADALAASLRAFSPDFTRIAPDGAAMDRAALAAFLEARRGTANGAYATEVHDARALWQSADAVLVRYTERQVVSGRANARIASALFTPDPAAPNGVLWRHLQETAIVPTAARPAPASEKDSTR